MRLSCLWPNTPLSAELPLLGERTKGARAVGTVRLTLQANYASAVSCTCMGSALKGPLCKQADTAVILSPRTALLHTLHPLCPACLPCPQKHLAKGYTAPALPKAAYVHGVAEKAHQVGAQAAVARGNSTGHAAVSDARACVGSLRS